MRRPMVNRTAPICKSKEDTTCIVTLMTCDTGAVLDRTVTNGLSVEECRASANPPDGFKSQMQWNARDLEDSVTEQFNKCLPEPAPVLVSIRQRDQPEFPVVDITWSWSGVPASDKFFEVERKQDAGAWLPLLTTSISQFAYSDLTVTPGHLWSYRLRLRVGTVSPFTYSGYSNVLSIFTTIP
jgi:hypothetical protein